MFNLQLITSSTECSPLPCGVVGAAVLGLGSLSGVPTPRRPGPLAPL